MAICIHVFPSTRKGKLRSNKQSSECDFRVTSNFGQRKQLHRSDHGNERAHIIRSLDSRPILKESLDG